MMDFAIAGVQVPAFLLIFTGITVGIVGGFIGVGGGYMVTPALVVFGFPGYMASGTDLTHIAGKGVISTIRHRSLGNIDWTLGLSMVAGTELGVEIGTRILTWTKELGLSTVAVLTASLIVMVSLFIYTQIETSRSHKQLMAKLASGEKIGREFQTSRIPHFLQRIPFRPIVKCQTARVAISMWVIVLVGLFTGALAGFLGVGGGFIRVPALVYLVGASSHIAVGTDLLEIVFSGSYGALRHAMQGNVDFSAVMLMLTGALFGAQFGSIITAYVRGPAIRYILGYSLMLASLGAALPLINTLTGGSIPILAVLAIVLTLGQMIFLCGFILEIFYLALRANRGKWVPEWVVPLVVKAEEKTEHIDIEKELAEVRG